MWKRVCLSFAVSLIAGIAAAQGISDLFESMRNQVKAGSWSEGVSTIDRLEAEAAKPGNEKIESQLEAPMAFYRGVCEANLDQPAEAGADFESFLRLQPAASIDAAAYSAKTVAAFDEARRMMRQPQPSLPRLYQDFHPPAATPVAVTAAWSKGPAGWLFTDGEKSAWSKLKTDPERVEFVEAFWSARSIGKGGAFRSTFEKRVAFADAYLMQDDKTAKPGSMTDRGMVLILLGPPLYARRSVIAAPASIADRNTSPGTPALGNNGLELWHYRGSQLPKGVSLKVAEFEFVSRGGGPSNVLRDDADLAKILKAARRPAA